MLHACAIRFDVTGNLEKFWKLNKATSVSIRCVHVAAVTTVTRDVTTTEASAEPPHGHMQRTTSLPAAAAVGPSSLHTIMLSTPPMHASGAPAAGRPGTFRPHLTTTTTTSQPTQTNNTCFVTNTNKQH